MAQLYVYSYGSGSVTTSAYTTLVTSTPITVSKLQVTDTSGQLLKIAVGNPGSEVDIFCAPVSGSQIINYYLQAGQRLSIKAISNTASSGYNAIAFLNA